jgi:hypothetical protein
MPPTSNLFRAARPAFRARHFFFRPKQRNTARFQSTAAGSAEQATAESWAKRMWNSPVGLKTVHFWSVPISSNPLILYTSPKFVSTKIGQNRWC